MEGPGIGMAPMPIFDNGDCSASLTGCVEKGPHGAKFAVASDKFKELQEKDPRQLVEDAKDYAKTQRDALKEGLHEGKEAYKRAASRGTDAV